MLGAHLVQSAEIGERMELLPRQEPQYKLQRQELFKSKFGGSSKSCRSFGQQCKLKQTLQVQQLRLLQ